MPNVDRLRKLESKKVELIKEIQLYEYYKEKIVRFVNELNNKYDSGLISYEQYYNELNKVLKQRTPKQWIKYYNECINYCNEHLDYCNEEIRKEQSRDRTNSILITLAIFMIVGLSIFFIRPIITGFTVTENITIIENITENVTLPVSNITTLENISIENITKENITIVENITIQENITENVSLPVEEKNITIAQENVTVLENITEEFDTVTIPKAPKFVKKEFKTLDDKIEELDIKIPKEQIKNITRLGYAADEIELKDKEKRTLIIHQPIFDNNLTFDKAVPLNSKDDFTYTSTFEDTTIDIEFDSKEVKQNKTEKRFNKVSNASGTSWKISYDYLLPSYEFKPRFRISSSSPIEITDSYYGTMQSGKFILDFGKERENGYNIEINVINSNIVYLYLNKSYGDYSINVNDEILIDPTLTINGAGAQLCGDNDTYDKIEIVNSGRLTICAKSATASTGYVNISLGSNGNFSLISGIIDGSARGGRGGAGVSSATANATQGDNCTGVAGTTSSRNNGGGGGGADIRSSTSNSVGGCGGGFGGVGGYGGFSAAGRKCREQWKTTEGSTTSLALLMGAGGSGSNGDTGYAGGVGGAGIRINASAGEIYIAGTVNISGNNGVAGDGDDDSGGGGGAGGHVILIAKTLRLNNSANISVNGGNGGIDGGANSSTSTDSCSGGGGGGGRIVYVYQTATVGATFVNETSPGGAGGGDSACDAAGDIGNASAGFPGTVAHVVTTWADATPPVIILSRPSNAITSTTKPITFEINTTEDVNNLQNVSLIGNWSGSWVINETYNTNTTSNSSQFSVRVPDGNYSWSAYSCNNQTLCTYDDINYTIKVDTNAPSITISGPADAATFTTKPVRFECNATDSTSVLANISLITNWTGSWVINESSTITGQMTNTSNWNIRVPEGNYSWSCYSCDVNKICAYGSTNRTLKVDTTPPTLALSRPSNAAAFTTKPITFECNLTDTSLLSNVSLVTNWTGSWIINETKTITNGLTNTTNWDIRAPEGNYSWSCYACDVNKICGFNETNRTLKVDTLAPAFTFSRPANNSIELSNPVRFEINLTDTSVLANISLITNWTGSWIINETKTITNGLTNTSNWDVRLLDGNFTYTYYACDVNKLCGYAGENRTLKVDTNPPAITLSIPADAATFTTKPITFEINATDTTSLLSNISLVTNWTGSWVINETSVISGQKTNTSRFSVRVPEGNYTWSAYSCDVNDFCAYGSTNRTVKVDTLAPDINLSRPADLDVFDTLPITFECNLSDDSILKNISLVTNWTGSWEINETMTISGQNTNTTNWNVRIPAGNYSWSCYACDVNTLCTYDDTNRTVAYLSNQPPTINNISSPGSVSVSAGTYVWINFTFIATDPNGVLDLNNLTASGRYNISAGDDKRFNSSCKQVKVIDDTQANYSCSIAIWYFDSNGDWTINASIKDAAGVYAQNLSASFTLGLTTAMNMTPTALTWSSVNLLSTNVLANQNITVFNIGNKNITANNVNVTAIDMEGETTTTEYLLAGNFTVNTANVCNTGNVMVNATTVNITSSILTAGNFTASSAPQEELFFCLEEVTAGISQQSYSTTGAGAWTIVVFAAAIIPNPAFWRKKKKTKIVENDRLIQALYLITEELKEEYSLNKKEVVDIIFEKLREKYKISRKELKFLIKTKEELSIPVTIFSKELGALEALIKYMKENLVMSYHEIAKLLNRNDRTIWTAYHKALQKQIEPIKPQETEILLPISIFRNRNLTILESVIIYLKSRGLKYNEIARLLNRDQRNIWIIYSRALKKYKKLKD